MPVWNTGRRGRRVMGDIEGGKVVKGSILFMRTETELQTCLWYSCLQTQLNEKTQISEAKSCLWRKNWEADSVTHCPFLPTPKVSLEIWCCSAFCKNEFFLLHLNTLVCKVVHNAVVSGIPKSNTDPTPSVTFPPLLSPVFNQSQARQKLFYIFCMFIFNNLNTRCTRLLIVIFTDIVVHDRLSHTMYCTP